MDHDNEPTLRDLIALIRRGLLVAIVLAAAAAAVTYYVSSGLPPSFEASATLLVSAQDPNQRDFGVTLVTAPPLDSATYAAAIRSRNVLADALENARAPAPSQLEVNALAARVTVRAEDARVSSTIRVTVRDDDAGEARDLANAVAAAAVRWDEARATRALETIIASLVAQIASVDQEIETADAEAPIDGLTRNRAELQLQLSSARALRTAAVGRLELLERAETPLVPYAPRPMRSAAIAGMFAVLLTYGLLLLRTALNTRVRDPEDLARITELPVLAEFPKVSSGRRGLPREAASYLRTAVTFAASDVHPKVILVTSTGPNHGKSSVSIALAESFARQSYRTLLIDADLRKPVLGREYGLHPPDHPCLRDALVNGVDAVTVCSLSAAVELSLIPSFEPAPNPTELLANNLRLLLEVVRQEYDVIVIDSAPVLPVADALVIAPEVDGVVFAVSMRGADRRHVRNAIDLLRRIGVRVYGTVATNLRSGAAMRSAAGYGYGYGYGAGYGGIDAAAIGPPRTGITRSSVRRVKA